MGLLGKLFGAERRVDSPDLLAAIERAIDRVEPRLKQIGGYPDRYRKPVAHALEYVRTLATQVPGPVAVNRDAYASDPLVHALFSSPDEIRAALCASQAMHDYRRVHPGACEVYALLCMRRGDKIMLGMELSGDMLRRDVPQHAIYFTSHTLADPGRTEAEARECIAQGFFDSLIAHVSARIEARKQEKIRLEQARDELLAHLRASSAERRTDLEDRLKVTLTRLADLAGTLDLRLHVHDFEAVLGEPEQYLHIVQADMTLDGMGILHEADAPGGTVIKFSDLIGRDRRRWTVALMHCDHVEDAPTISDRLLTAQRWLGLS
jgi:hypothetical protein